MTRSRVSAVLSAVVASLAMTLGLLAFTSGAASATPQGPYPPPPPSLVVNKGVVKYGVTVRATGRQFGAKEKVFVTVYFKAKGSNKVKVVRTATVFTNSKGKFGVNVKMSRPGVATIAVKGKTSRKTAQVSVQVIDKKKGGWTVKPVAHTTGLTGPGAGATTLTSTPQSAPADTAGLGLAALGVVALAGSAVVARRTIRRRRTAVAA